MKDKDIKFLEFHFVIIDSITYKWSRKIADKMYFIAIRMLTDRDDI